MLPIPADAGRVDAVDELRCALATLMGAERRLKGHAARARSPLGHSHLRALVLLLDEGETTAGALARATNLNPASVTAMIVQLEQRGLLVRRRHERDRRVCLLALTDAGRAQVAASEEAWAGRLHEALADTSEADLRAASLVLERLAAAMERARREVSGSP